MSFRQLLADAANREAALAQSGLPSCQWMTERIHELETRVRPDVEQRIAEIETHLQSCPTCLARERYTRARFGNPPPATKLRRDLSDVLLDIDAKSRPVKGLAAAALGGAFLLLCAGLAIAPHAGAIAAVVYVLALGGAAFMAWAGYQIIGLIGWAGFVGRWFARSTAGVAAMLTFVWSFRLSGYSSVLTPAGGVKSARDDIKIAVIMGVLYGTFLPLVARLRRLQFGTK